MQSSWYEAFRADMRSSVVVRAVEASVGGVGTVTSVASSWTSASLSSATRSLRYPPCAVSVPGLTSYIPFCNPNVILYKDAAQKPQLFPWSESCL